MFEGQSSPYIRELRKGLLEEGYFLLKKMLLNIGRKNKPYLRMVLSDKSGHIPAVFFGSISELQSLQSKLKEGNVVKVQGIVEEYQDTVQLKLVRVEPDSRQNWDSGRFWKRTPHDRRKLYRELKEILTSISDSKLRELCFSFLKDRAFMKLFLDAPASRFVHHAYIGGLLEHTLSVVRLLRAIAPLYPDADRDLLLSGGFIRKIGKADEYDFLLHEFDYSVIGRLKGHTLLGYDRLVPRLNQAGLDAGIRLKLEHILLSHQGRKAWGAIEPPKFLEAWLVHAADQLDATQFIFSEPRREYLREENRNDARFITFLDKEIYLG